MRPQAETAVAETGGRRLSFYSERDGDREIYVMNGDAGERRRLMDSPGNDEVPDWVASP